MCLRKSEQSVGGLLSTSENMLPGAVVDNLILFDHNGTNHQLQSSLGQQQPVTYSASSYRCPKVTPFASALNVLLTAVSRQPLGLCDIAGRARVCMTIGCECTPCVFRSRASIFCPGLSRQLRQTVDFQVPYGAQVRTHLASGGMPQAANGGASVRSGKDMRPSAASRWQQWTPPPTKTVG